MHGLRAGFCLGPGRFVGPLTDDQFFPNDGQIRRGFDPKSHAATRYPDDGDLDLIADVNPFTDLTTQY
jgi:hypothetical protein